MQNNLDKYLDLYSQKKLKVFPVQKQGKRPLTKNGFKDASSNLKTINKFWSKYPDANIGIPTGKLNNIEVLDIDVKSGGLKSLRSILNKVGSFPTTQVALTGGSGFHFYFKYSNQNYTNRTNIFPGVDFKTDGGYVVAPPSIHESGNRYQWIDFNYSAFINGEDKCYTIIQ